MYILREIEIFENKKSTSTHCIAGASSNYVEVSTV